MEVISCYSKKSSDMAFIFFVFCLKYNFVKKFIKNKSRLYLFVRSMHSLILADIFLKFATIVGLVKYLAKVKWNSIRVTERWVDCIELETIFKAWTLVQRRNKTNISNDRQGVSCGMLSPEYVLVECDALSVWGWGGLVRASSSPLASQPVTPTRGHIALELDLFSDWWVSREKQGPPRMPNERIVKILSLSFFLFRCPKVISLCQFGHRWFRKRGSIFFCLSWKPYFSFFFYFIY